MVCIVIWVLLFGGIVEGCVLVKELYLYVEIVSLLVGWVFNFVLLIGLVCIGGFGGVEGLCGWL